MWPLRIAVARLRPVNGASLIRLGIIALTFAVFIYGDFVLFRRLFRGLAQVEAMTPIFALGLLRNLLGMVFLVATVVLFSSALTAAIGAYFTDLDLEVLHSAPRSKLRIVVGRWGKTLLQSAAIVFCFLVPLFAAFAAQYALPWTFHVSALTTLVALLSIPVSLASLAIMLLVRWFPVRRVYQIVVTLAVLVLTVAVIAFRMSKPERFFTAITTDDVARVIRAIELPAMDLYPSTALADLMIARASHRAAPLVPPKIGIIAAGAFLAFIVVARGTYYRAFVRARESMAPAAIGAAGMTALLDRMLGRVALPTRALVAKEIRVVTRDVAQWSQLFLMVALLFIYLYNIRMLPLGGDARATIVAYANVGMAGFVIAAICLRFAYPSVSAEGKAFWIVQTSPVSYRNYLRMKVLVYATPLTLLSLTLTAMANLILHASPAVWFFTLFGSSLLAVTLVSMGVGMGAIAPNFGAENPLQVGLSLGGFAYMAASLAYVSGVMILMARPIIEYVLWRLLGIGDGSGAAGTLLPLVIALAASALLCAIPLRIGERSLVALTEK
jgi:ABC-2 type transport system permease protein